MLQKKYNLLLFTVGCNAIVNGSDIGHSKNINSMKAVESISATEKATTFSELYDGLSYGDNRCFINIKQIEKQIIFEGFYRQYLSEEIILNKEKEARLDIFKVVTYSRLNEADTINKTRPALPIKTIYDEETPFNFFFLILKVVAFISILLWAIFKFTNVTKP